MLQQERAYLTALSSSQKSFFFWYEDFNENKVLGVGIIANILMASLPVFLSHVSHVSIFLYSWLLFPFS